MRMSGEKAVCFVTKELAVSSVWVVCVGGAVGVGATVGAAVGASWGDGDLETIGSEVAATLLDASSSNRQQDPNLRTLVSHEITFIFSQGRNATKSSHIYINPIR